MPATKARTKRHNLVLPSELYHRLQQVAEEKHTTITDLIKRFVKLGLLAVEVENSPGSELIIRENGAERRILLL